MWFDKPKARLCKCNAIHVPYVLLKQTKFYYLFKVLFANFFLGRLKLGDICVVAFLHIFMDALENRVLGQSLDWRLLNDAKPAVWSSLGLTEVNGPRDSWAWIIAKDGRHFISEWCWGYESRRCVEHIDIAAESIVKIGLKSSAVKIWLESSIRKLGLGRPRERVWCGCMICTCEGNCNRQINKGFLEKDN